MSNSKRHVDRAKLFVEKATCSICGAKVAVSDEAMQLHLLSRHPLELMQHPAVMSKVAHIAFDLGRRLADSITRR